MKNIPIFVCDKQLWNSMSNDEQQKWLDWAETLGVSREPKLLDRNPEYPDLICAPTVSVGAFSFDDIT